ncbi:Intradiol ring-cleavage dioxygenase, core [Niveomyces insectorum RCEF 264]|uniref:Intradiol ring-cleavage dioxygenase, core n=1 Tax=Niveomyces insectorum RCEF 264 TaxID=1081102 RepID=A0A167XB27_9HYPO|nr:Intradiol ring-cleavage dioxygenase, core [Niveomyces insectorum RCEF 264]
MKPFITASIVVLSLLGGALTHPGEHHDEEFVKRGIAARELAGAHAHQVVNKCAGTAVHSTLQARAAARRALTAQLLREERDIVHKSLKSKRQENAINKWMGECHDQTSVYHGTLNASSTETAIFTSNATHALTPESIVGPYFVAGELVRKNITEGQAGVPVHLDMQFLDINTCQPIPNMLIDVWHANATGVYSGVVGSGGLNTTFLRGFQVTDHDGVVEFDTLYPGHYFGRTQHIHVMSRLGGKILANGTYTGGTVNHIGQLYFDQELSGVIEAMEPYASNWLPVTYNSDDFLTAQAASDDYDPFPDYVMLSEDANDGLLMWITIGINTTADYDNQAWAAATWRKGGGVAAPMPTFPFPLNGTLNGTTNGTFPPMPMGGPGFPGGFPGMPTASAKGSKPTPKPWGACEKKQRLGTK